MHPHIKVGLMGAAMDTGLFERYFSVPEQTVRITDSAVTRTIVHCEGLSTILPLALHAQLRSLTDSTATCTVVRGQPVLEHVTHDQLALAVGLVKHLASEDSSILVFVAGMADICDLYEAFEKTKTAPLKLRVVIIHPDMPHEEQLLVLQPLAMGEARVIIATQAAESSLTLPDCDYVICLGADDVAPPDGR